MSQTLQLSREMRTVGNQVLVCAARAFRHLLLHPLSHLLAVSVMTVALVLVGLSTLFAQNIAALTHHWGEGAALTVFFQPDYPLSRLQSLKRSLAARGEIVSVRHISSRQAFAQLKRGLGPDGDQWLLAQHSTLLPQSLELRLKPEVSREQMRPLVGMLAALEGVSEVDYTGQWAERLGQLAGGVRYVALVLTILVGIAMFYLVLSTIRIAAFERRDEVEVQKRLGATNGFVRAPFIVEGAVQGIVAAALALFILYALFHFSVPKLQQSLSLVIGDHPISFLSPWQVAWALLGALTVGLVGSTIAVRRYVRV